MTQQKIADALGINRTQVARRIAWNSLDMAIKKTVCDGTLDEGHLEAISGVECDVAQLSSWLTTEKAQPEILDYILDNHVGKSQGIKPTVKRVRGFKCLYQEQERALTRCPECRHAR